jgi:hypothetical protein
MSLLLLILSSFTTKRTLDIITKEQILHV